ncbi:unnamed protein product [Rhodiola kirilowii]
MGRGRKQNHTRGRNFHTADDDDDRYEAGHSDQVSAVENLPSDEEEEEEEEEAKVDDEKEACEDLPSKFSLYQQSVQSPKGDISYLLKFFLMYVGGRVPLHFQEDFCGTALLSTEWIRNDTRRTAIGLDLDLEALEWCLENNHCPKGGGIFVMDLYGGTSSECGLKLQRKFPNFTYIWEQEEFDIVQRKTRISLHFHLKKQQKKIRHAFSYSWRLWSLPEIKDCMEEAGFQSVHFWMRQMPDTENSKITEGFGVGRDLKYEEVTKFEQQDAWNAYIVGVAN